MDFQSNSHWCQLLYFKITNWKNENGTKHKMSTEKKLFHQMRNKLKRSQKNSTYETPMQKNNCLKLLQMSN